MSSRRSLVPHRSELKRDLWVRHCSTVFGQKIADIVLEGGPGILHCEKTATESESNGAELAFLRETIPCRPRLPRCTGAALLSH